MTVKILGHVFWVFAAFACAGGGGTGRPTPADQDREISVEIQNQNFYGATVYAYLRGSRTRLGMVESHSTKSFEFLWTTGDLRFLVDFLANGCILTDQLNVNQGDLLLLVLEPQDYRKASQAVCRA